VSGSDGRRGHDILCGVSNGGRRVNRDEPSRVGPSLPYLVAMVLGAVLSALAWVFLVRSAIEFGRLARGGQNEAWLFTLAASAGAVVCALLVLVLVARVLRALGLVSDYKPRRAAARRRAR
jgi:hypothetical protein